MIQHLRFAILYAWRSFVRNKQRTWLALFSIAAGVATVITLRMLGLSLTDALTANAQAFLRSDILVAPGAAPLRLTALSDPDNRPLLLPEDVHKLNAWAVSQSVEITYRYSGQLHQVLAEGEEASQAALAFGYFIDPQKYPFYDTIRALEPAGVPLGELFTGPHPVVVARRLAEDLALQVGDSLRIGSADSPFIVTGIVPDSAETYLDNPFQIAFSFVYLDWDRLPEFGVATDTADRAYVKLAPEINPEVFVDTLYDDWRALVPELADRAVRYDRVGNILRRNREISDFLAQSVLLFSLIALVIGGVGILNTLSVTVKRRTEEIAVLKTLGLRRREIAGIFFIHALLLGIGGSLVGTLFGLGLSLLAKHIGEYAFGIPLPWTLAAEPIALGVGLGIGTTAIFSLLPALSAANVTPRLLLRQHEVGVARAGARALISTGLLLVTGGGVIVNRILGIDVRRDTAQTSLIGPLATAVGIVLLLLLARLMAGLVWLVGQLPTFGSPHLLLALRGLARQRGRTAATLLALVIGMSSLSATLILSRSIGVLAFGAISNPLGGNVPLLPLTQGLVRTRLADTAAVTSYYDLAVTQGQLIAIDGDPSFLDTLQPAEQVTENVYLTQLNTLNGIRGYGALEPQPLLAGRLLSPEDAGQQHIVVPYNPILLQLGVQVGSTLTYQIGAATETFTIVGILRGASTPVQLPFGIGSGVMAPLETLPPDWPVTLLIVNVRPEGVAALSESLRGIPGVFVVNAGQFDTVVNRVLRQTAALPLLIAGLSLLAASILVANTVSLSTLERRREIGVLKALGLKPRQILAQLLLQNGIIGLLGGLLSLLPTLIAIALIPVVTEELVELPLPLDLIAALLTVSTGITLVATLLTGWSAAHDAPTAALRYE